MPSVERSNLTAGQRSQRSAIAASAWYATATREQVDARAANARRNSPADISYWERRIDPDGRLSPEERTRRASYAKKLHFLRLAFKSSKARSAKRGDQ